jgi:hypothetical protein
MVERVRQICNKSLRAAVPWLSWQNALRGALVYTSGDTAAALLLDQFTAARMFGIMLVGSTLYAVEIPAYFRWVERGFGGAGWRRAIGKALLAQAFFNPLWIARHLALVKCFGGHFDEIDGRLLVTATESFLHMLPVGVVMNYLIQNRVPLSWRFFASACYSAVTTLYFALGEVLFG